MPRLTIRTRSLTAALALAGFSPAGAQTLPLDTLRSHLVDLRFGMFMHFGIETFTGDYWQNPTPPAGTGFQLKTVDCDQWAATAKSAGMTFGVLVTKHHYGFCIFNTSTTTYNSMNYGLKKDIVQAYVTAFRKAGLLPGIYYSIFDVTEGVTAGAGSNGDGTANRTNWTTKKAVILQQLRELLTNYGTIPMIVLDGWAWKSGHNDIPLQEVREFIKSLQPNIVIIDHGGVPQPWDNDAIMFEEPKGEYAPVGNTYAAVQGQTISTTNNWFWQGNQPLMTASSIVQHLTNLQPRNTTFILNCPPNSSGVQDANVVDTLAKVGKMWAPIVRSPFPAQIHSVEHPVTAVSAKDANGASAWNAIDGLNDYYTETIWTGASAQASVTLDLGSKYYNLEILAYLPPQWTSSTGNITGYTISLSDDNKAFQQVASGTWSNNSTIKVAEWPPAAGRYLKLATTSTGGNGKAAIGELTVGGRLDMPSLTPTSSTRPTFLSPTRRLRSVPGGIVADGIDGIRQIRVMDIHGCLLAAAAPQAGSVAIPVGFHGTVLVSFEDTQGMISRLKQVLP